MGEIDLRIESLRARETSAIEPPIPTFPGQPLPAAAIFGSSGGTSSSAATLEVRLRMPS